MQRYEHKSTHVSEGEDPYAPQAEGWELVSVVQPFQVVGVGARHLGSVYFESYRVLYWKRPVQSIKGGERQ